MPEDRTTDDSKLPPPVNVTREGATPEAVARALLRRTRPFEKPARKPE